MKTSFLYTVYFGARYPSGKGEVCKTFMRGFDSHPRLHQNLDLLIGFRATWEEQYPSSQTRQKVQERPRGFLRCLHSAGHTADRNGYYGIACRA